jgi:hypothetical protein
MLTQAILSTRTDIHDVNLTHLRTTVLTALAVTWAAAFVAARLNLSGNLLQLSLPGFTSATNSAESSGASRTLQHFAQQYLGGAALGLALRLRLISK